MDPQTNLHDQIRLAHEIQALSDANFETTPDIAERAERLADLVLALDTWIRNGGFLPPDWEIAQKVRRAEVRAAELRKKLDQS